jgi:hypothetical protein
MVLEKGTAAYMWVASDVSCPFLLTYLQPMIWHPESAGRAHIVGMIDKFIGKLVSKMEAAEPGEITFETMASVASSWKDRKG